MLQAADVDCLITIEYYSEQKYTDYNKNRYIFVVQGLPNFLTRDLITLNNTLSISYSQRPLAAGPIRNAENIESLLTILYRPYTKQCANFKEANTRKLPWPRFNELK